MRPPDLQRIKHIYDYCVEIASTIERYGDSFEAFQGDKDYQRSISFSLMQIGELSNGLTDEYRNRTADRVPWHKIRGMRNMFAHDYGHMDQTQIWKTARQSVAVLRDFCSEELE